MRIAKKPKASAKPLLQKRDGALHQKKRSRVKEVLGMQFTEVKALSKIKQDYDLILFDLWGVIVEGASTYEGVVDVVNSLMKEKRILFVSNAPRDRAQAAERLRRFGVNCRDDQMFTSGQMSRDLVDGQGNDRLVYNLNIGNDTNTLASSCMATDKIEEASVLLLSAQLDEGQDLHMFDELFQKAVDAGVLCICANPDRIIPNQGKLRYCPGYFADIYVKMGGKAAIIGKPGKDIFIQAISSINPQPDLSRILMIGDTLDTDILGAQNSDIHSALVLTGNSAAVTKGCSSTQEKLDALSVFCKSHDIFPTMLLDLCS